MSQLCSATRAHTAANTSGDYTQICCCRDELPALPSCCGGTHKERLKDLGLFRLQKSCLHEDSVAGFTCLVVTERKKPDFAQQCMPKDPGEGHKPLWGKFCLDNRDRKFHSEGCQTQQCVAQRSYKPPCWRYSKLSWTSCWSQPCSEQGDE